MHGGITTGRRPLAVPGVLTAEELLATGRAIAAQQQPDGAVGWPDGHVDAWNHVECAMALSTCGLHDAARRAYTWLAATQRPDGSWPRQFSCGRVTDAAAESNHCAYPAVGVWHEYLRTGDRAFAERMWPVVRSGLEFTLGLQVPRGEVLWQRDAAGRPASYALLTGCASIHHALRCGLALADFLAEPQPGWELAADLLGHTVAGHPEAFADKSRYSMDWYYPVLGGPLRGRAAASRLAAHWDTFVVPGLGVRCVSDEPWVTGAETCELVLALAATGDRETAAALFGQIQHLRDGDGSYWTGWQFVNQAHFPAERSAWTAAAMVLAADALSGATGGAAVFTLAAAPWCGAPQPSPPGRTALSAGLPRSGHPGSGTLPRAEPAACGCDLARRSPDAVGGPLQHP